MPPNDQLFCEYGYNEPVFYLILDIVVILSHGSTKTDMLFVCNERADQ